MSEFNEQNVTCDTEGCRNYFFVTGSCLITNDQLEAIGKAMGWSFVGETGAYCAHHPQPKAKPKNRAKRKR